MEKTPNQYINDDGELVTTRMVIEAGDYTPTWWDKNWKNIAYIILFCAVVYFSNRYIALKLTIRCYEEQQESISIGRGYFIQEELKEACARKGIVIKGDE